jgi:glycine/D-amino acid oxidase-like deaminating enzyme
MRSSAGMLYPWPADPPSDAHLRSFSDAERRPFWLDDLPARDPDSALVGRTAADLCIVGGGFTGLWAALHAKADDSRRDVVVLEAESVGYGASGRNGGFAVASLTHGISNGMARFAGEMPALERLAHENFTGLRRDLDHHGIDCDLEPSGELTAIVDPRQARFLEEDAELLRRFGHDVEVLDAAAMRQEIASPLFHGGLWDRTDAGILDPAKLVDGLRCAAIHEHTAATALRESGAGIEVVTAQGHVAAGRVLLATSAFPPLVRAVRRYVAPVYDYVLVSEPLSRAQRDAIGWHRRQGVGDEGNQFHYYRLTADDRILWGGYDAVYRFGSRIDRTLEQGPTHQRLAEHFFTTFPQLSGLRFSHAWGGVIDTCTRFAAFYGTAMEDRVGYALGFTGLGVGATRFAGDVVLDLLAGQDTPRTRLEMVRKKPVPFPPEPLRWAGIEATRRSLARADANGGKENLWLRAMDRLGLGFDS